MPVTMSVEYLSFWDHLFRDSLEVSYMKAIEEAAGEDKKIRFIDPDRYESALKAAGIDYHSIESRSILKQNLDALPEDKMALFREELKSAFSIQCPPEKMDEALEGLAKMLVIGPSISQWSDNTFMAVLPADFIDTKEEFVNEALEGAFDKETLANITKNIDITEDELAKSIGYHEGGHARQYHSQSTYILSGKIKEIGQGTSYHIDRLKEAIELEKEVGADKIEAQENIKHGNADIALINKDLRALSHASSDGDHLTSALRDSDDPVTSTHVNIAKGLLLAPDEDGVDIMDELIYGAPPNNSYSDWYENVQGKKYDLLKNDPEAFFEAMNEGLERKKAAVMEEYKSNPTSIYSKGDVVEAQILCDYAHAYEAAYRRRALGQTDFPDHEPTRLIPEDHIREVLEETQKQDMLGAFNEIREYDILKRYNAESEKILEGSEYDTLRELKQNDRQTYFEKHAQFLGQIKDEALAKYEADPSPDNTKNLVEAQYLVTRFSSVHNAELYVHMRQNDPTMDIKPVNFGQFVTEEQFHQYYQHMAEDLHINDTSYSGKLASVNFSDDLARDSDDGAYRTLQEVPEIQYDEYTNFMNGLETKGQKTPTDEKIKTNAADISAKATSENMAVTAQFNNATGAQTEVQSEPQPAPGHTIAQNTPSSVTFSV